MDTIIEGSTDRLNPIIMTALTSMLALIPLAIGGELPGNEIQSPMAKVILGGLFTSTLLNMFYFSLMLYFYLKTNHVYLQTIIAYHLFLLLQDYL